MDLFCTKLRFVVSICISELMVQIIIKEQKCLQNLINFSHSIK